MCWMAKTEWASWVFRLMHGRKAGGFALSFTVAAISHRHIPLFLLLLRGFLLPAQPLVNVLWRFPDVPQELVWFWMVADAVKSVLNSSTRIVARHSLAITPRGWNATLAPVPQLWRGSAEHSQKEDPVNTTPKFIRMEKVFSPIANTSVPALMELLAVSHCAHKNSPFQIWAVPTQD